MFKKNVGLVGLDIGSRTIKAAEIIETKSGNNLNSFGAVDIPPGLIEEGGGIKDPAAVAELIRQLFKTNNIKEQNVAISVGHSVIIKHNVNVDAMEEDQLHDTIHYEVEQYIPFDINDIDWDFHIIGESQTAANKMEVILVAAKKELISNRVDLVHMAGLNPCIIDVDAFALQNIFEINYDPSEESVALIDIGASNITLSILKDNTSVFTRDASLGCGQITQEIMSSLDCSFDEAEKIKQSEQSESISTSDLRGIKWTVVEDWSQEITRALDFFYSTNPEDRIKRLVLSGGGALVKEVNNFLSQEVDAEVEVINPFKKLNINSDRVDRPLLEQMAPQTAICLGLALRRIADK